MSLSLKFVLPILLATASVSAADGPYIVVLDRRFKVGETVTVATDFELKVSITSDGVEKKVHQTASFKGTETVDLLSPASHQPMKVTIKVADSKHDGKEIVRAGAIVVADASSGVCTFTVDGDKPDDETAAALTNVVSVSAPAERPDSANMGTDGPKNIGDAWKMKPESLAKDLNIGFVALTAKDVSGEVRLTGVEKSDGREIETITGTFNGNFASANVDDRKFKNYKSSGTWVRLLPIDETAHLCGASNSMSVSFQITNPGGANVEFTSEVTKKTGYSPAKP